MAWIRTVGPAEATGESRDLYARMCNPDGTVDNVLTIHGVNPAVLCTHFELYKACMFGPSELSRAQREMVAVVVSAANHCHY